MKLLCYEEYELIIKFRQLDEPSKKFFISVALEAGLKVTQDNKSQMKIDIEKNGFKIIRQKEKTASDAVIK